MSIKTSVAVVVALLAAPILAVAQTQWIDYPGNPVIPAPDPGAWDAERYLGAVVKVDGTYHMYFSGRRAGGPGVLYFEIGHATSTDGVIWDPDWRNPVMTLGVPGAWDHGTVWLGAVIHDVSGFRMWYGGNDGQVCRAGYATSPDGSLWTKHPDWVMDVGPPGSFDEQWVLLDTVVVRDDHYQAWYWAADFSGVWRIGYAESDDGFIWEKYPSPVIDPGYGPEVLFDGQFYGMWYTVGYSPAAIYYAVSPDGVAWIPYSSNPVVGVGSGLPAVLFDSGDGVYKMWYQGPDFSVRMATSDCCGPVFVNGFESGDTSAWSATVP